MMRNDSTPHPATGWPVPERAEPPRPMRLDRNALTIAGVVLGVLVIAAVVLVPPSHPAAHAVTQPPPPDLPRNTFLDRPIDQQGIQVEDARSLGTAPPLPVTGANVESGTVTRPSSGGLVAAPASPRAILEPSPASAGAEARRVTFEAALAAPLTATAAHAERTPEDAAPSGIDAGAAGWAVAPAAASLPGVSADALPPSNSSRPPNSLGKPTQAVIDSAPGPLAIQAGTVIPAVLVTEIDSDLPGQVLAQVGRDVFDTRTEQVLLIPKGSRLLGKYDSHVGTAQARLLVAWTRLVFPDGRSVRLDGLETKDASGAGGLHDQVDRHTGHVFGTASLLSLIGAGAQLSQPNGGYGPAGSLGYPSAGQVAAGAMGQELAQVATEMLRRDLDVQPTIRIRQGMPLNVFLTSDLVFPTPYTPR